MSSEEDTSSNLLYPYLEFKQDSEDNFLELLWQERTQKVSQEHAPSLSSVSLDDEKYEYLKAIDQQQYPESIECFDDLKRIEQYFMGQDPLRSRTCITDEFEADYICECACKMGYNTELDKKSQHEDSCKFFGTTVEFANYFVDGILKEAMRRTRGHIRNWNTLGVCLTSTIDKSKCSCKSSEDEASASEYSHQWPRIENFSVVEGQYAISDYLRNFYMREEWKTSIKFLASQSDNVSDFYFYEVTYTLEGSNIIFSPKEKGFSENMLINILLSKVQFYRCVSF